MGERRKRGKKKENATPGDGEKESPSGAEEQIKKKKKLDPLVLPVSTEDNPKTQKTISYFLRLKKDNDLSSSTRSKSPPNISNLTTLSSLPDRLNGNQMNN